ncbi:MAG: DUF3108 domain-containing protein [Muribaculaceae bacterium]|nr:DUF3108 domain-containing protein [Muribaculaceae bacterium]
MKIISFKSNIASCTLLSVIVGVLMTMSLNAFGNDFTNERLKYVISYKWGLIHKDAGEAVLSLKNSGNKYSLILTAKTKPWADSFYQVRDTLLGSVQKEGFKPLSYSKIAHEKGKYSRDDIKYIYSGTTVGGNVKRTRVGKDGKISVNEKKLTGSGKVFDMLSVFYFLRSIDYANLAKGKNVRATVFSGSKAELLTIRCVGKENIKLRNKTKREAYHIKFNFTTEGKTKSSDDIDTWISADASHIPLLVIGNLPVGQVKCYYIPG